MSAQAQSTPVSRIDNEEAPLLSRPFAARDLERLVSWHAMARPSFLGGGNSVDAARAFLAAAESSGHEAICFRGADMSKVQGPVACVLRESFGRVAGVFVDPDFADEPAVTSFLRTLEGGAALHPRFSVV